MVLPVVLNLESRCEMTSLGAKHDELDFEFLGNSSGNPYVLQTNVFSNGQGGREQRILLWFDPRTDFHNYSLLWNEELIVFMVDNTTIRVFPNIENTTDVPYLHNQSMNVYASIWDGDSWATEGGRIKINWTNAPFVASYREFTADACHNTSTDPDATICASTATTTDTLVNSSRSNCEEGTSDTLVNSSSPCNHIDVIDAFSMAFAQIHGWEWASHLVGVGACIGILSSLLVAMLGQARYLCVIGHANVIPSCLASVNPSTGTPIYASMVLGFFTAIVALFTELDILVDLISIGTLFVFYTVANALIFRRHVSSGNTNPWPTLLFLVLILLLSVGFVLAWQLGHENYSGLIVCGAGIVIVTFCFQALCPTTEGNKEWEALFMLACPVRTHPQESYWFSSSWQTDRSTISYTKVVDQKHYN